MHWSVTITMVAALGATTPEVSQEFDSYSKAYWTASEVHRPMLVILNPAGETAQSLEHLKTQGTSLDLLKDYVVAVIDTGTEHGQQVYELFGKPALPRTVVIDERQQKQIYHTSEKLQPEQLTAVLQQYRDGVPVAVQAAKPIIQGSLNYYQQGAGGCPNCRKIQ